ncbi:MAG: aminotransferase class I/II-fold pyridoxal phosphate-dependent enzyme [Desulfobulbus sp.]|nr:aminotransferase class I/II-fold pyridoxal phosphate-dependent enzyme [Desulfobulbus sp.]
MIQGHGGNVFALAEALGCPAEDITDMSSNINPLGTMPGLIAHIKERLNRIRVLPEVDARASIRAIAKLLDVAPERILAGGGTTQFIYTACAALQAKRVLILGPTYADYTDGCRVHGIEPEFFISKAGDNFLPQMERLRQALAQVDTVFLCNPNNPTGQLIDHQTLRALCTAHPQVRFIIDESYLPFAPVDQTQSMTSCGLDNVIVLWSVSKIFGMPGLRAGFLVANQGVVERFSRYMQPWCVNSLAQEAVCFLGDHLAEVSAFIDQTRAFLARESVLLNKRLGDARLTLFPSMTSYYLMQLGEHTSATEVCALLGRQRFLIRNCANFHGLDERFIRIALKDSATNEAVCRHLRTAVGTREG